jgi:tRNA (adenine22-N1)-methyltransferase
VDRSLSLSTLAARLGPRLAAIAELVLPGLPFADIGTDHGRLPTALVLTGLVPWAVACDRAAPPLARARATIERARVADRVQVRLAEGLAALAPGEVATAVIAGMGGPTVSAMLAASGAQVREMQRLVLQPNFGHERLRRGLAGLGLKLVDERLVVERGRFYAILVTEPGDRGGVESDLDCLVGPYLLDRGGPLLTLYLEQEMRRCEAEAAGVASATRSGDPSRAVVLLRRRELLAEALVKTRGQGHPRSI